MNECASTRSKEVEECLAELGAALKTHGLTLPSLGVDLVTFAGRQPYALVSLGNCNLETARGLAAVLRRVGERKR
ncbi:MULTISPECIES: hypothetical protein [unclassified Streptomyces]|uniref:hypothetical protein n=1 Tax=unclassified Streptomyces TaxID=2593676 RepID=UPI002DD93200|nr:hypothetical protein [Streptomyces sp. NBC_01795]WSA91722.1 hypothetical protein OIE63_09245 [Streptomyces sp. NBC_01795]WSS44474.1 hypothetical protein OG220_30675 [Streptomyces sp. NBC_01187]